MIQTVVRAIAWLSLLAIFLFTDGPILFRPTTGFSPNAERFIALLFVGAIFSVAYPKHRLSVLTLLLAAVGAFEFMQFRSLGRHANIIDVIYKGAGVLVGVALGFVIPSGGTDRRA